MAKIKVKTLKKKHVDQMTPTDVWEKHHGAASTGIHYHMLDCLGRMEDTGFVILQEKMNKRLICLTSRRYTQDNSWEEWEKLPQLFAD